jgi:pyrophosphatase PpaX
VATYFKVPIPDAQTKKAMESRLTTMISGQATKTLVIKALLYIAKMYGIPWYKRFHYLLKTNEIYKQENPKTPLFPGVFEALELIKSQYSCKFGICTTSSPNEIAQRFMNRKELLNIFEDNIISRAQVKKTKPHPEGILKLSKKWNMPSNHIIMIGDMNVDIEAGKNAGTITVGVLCGFANLERMQTYNPNYIIQSVKNLPQILPEILKKMNNTL